MPQFRKLEPGERLKDHVEFTIISDNNMHSFNKGSGMYELDIAHKNAEIEVDVLHEDDGFFVGKDDFGVCVVYKKYITVNEDDIIEANIEDNDDLFGDFDEAAVLPKKIEFPPLSTIVFHVDEHLQLSQIVNISGSKRNMRLFGIQLDQEDNGASWNWNYERVYPLMLTPARPYNAYLYFEEGSGVDEWDGHIELVDICNEGVRLTIGGIKKDMFEVIGGYNPFQVEQYEQSIQ